MNLRTFLLPTAVLLSVTGGVTTIEAKKSYPLVYLGSWKVTQHPELSGEEYYQHGGLAYEGQTWNWCRESWLDDRREEFGANTTGGFGWSSFADRCGNDTMANNLTRAQVALRHGARADTGDSNHIMQNAYAYAANAIDSTSYSTTKESIAGNFNSGRLTLYPTFFGHPIAGRAAALLHEARHSDRGHNGGKIEGGGQRDKNFYERKGGAYTYQIVWLEWYQTMAEVPHALRSDAYIESFTYLLTSFDETPDWRPNYPESD